MKRLYDAAWFVLGEPDAGVVCEPAPDLSWAKFEAALRGRVGEILAQPRDSGFIALERAEVIDHEGPRNGLEEAEFATLEWVDWFNNVRLLEPIGYVPPAELEQAYYAHCVATEEEDGLKQESLH